jgi:hypothetical protein
MTRLPLRLSGAALLLPVLVAVPRSPATAEDSWSPTSVVVDWSAELIGSINATNVPPPLAGRSSAIVHASMFDAVNGVQQRFTPYHVTEVAPAGTSAFAAAAGAAHRALGALFPSRRAVYDDLLQQTLPQLRGSGGKNPAINRGLAWGAHVADAILEWRSHDGFSTAPAAYVGSSDPGRWQPTPPAFAAPAFRVLAAMTPFVMTSPSQYRTPAPPALTSARYALDFAEVASIGRDSSATRSSFDTQTARFWNSESGTGLWNRVTHALILRDDLPLAEATHLLALENLAAADAAIAVWEAKSYYDTWRPVTAIRAADSDGNPATVSDATWTPLLVTPPFQEYPSGHSGVSSASAQVLARYFGDDTSFTMTSAGMPGVTREFSSFGAALRQVADARVLAGIHFRFACDESQRIGTALADHVYDTVAQPR